ncbi:MAG: hypothetical protein ABSA76_13450 [Bacteroidales bacterium]
MDISEVIMGKDLHDQNEGFKEQLLKIEEKYSEFFERRPSKFEGEQHDRLHNHWMLYEDGMIIRFWFNKDSDLPLKIKEECIKAFTDIFGENKK